MENFVINLFIPHNDNGSDAAIVAHMYAHDNHGSVSIIRCKNNDEADQKIQELLHHITIADGYNAPQPKHREIWIVDLYIKQKIADELVLFKNHKAGRFVIRAHDAIAIWEGFIGYHNLPFSLNYYFSHARISDNNYSILRKMLEPEDYEHLVAYLLREYPKAEDVTKEDYVLSMFIEHERKKK